MAIRKLNIFALPAGDSTESDRQKYVLLMFQYRQFRAKESSLSAEARSRALMSFTGDFIDIGMDDAADAMMLEIDRICPKYFNGVVTKQMKGDPKFEKICCKVADFYGKLFHKAMKGK